MWTWRGHDDGWISIAPVARTSYAASGCFAPTAAVRQSWLHIALVAALDAAGLVYLLVLKLT